MANLQTMIYRDNEPLENSDSTVVKLRIENANSRNAGQYLCYGFTQDRSSYAVKSFNIQVGDDRTDGGSQPESGNKFDKTSDVGTNIELACELSSDDADLKWRKLDGVSYTLKYKNIGVVTKKKMKI